MISNSFFDNGFNDIVGFGSRTVPLKKLGLDSDLKEHIQRFLLMLQLQPKSIIFKKVLMTNQNPMQILLEH